MTTRTSTARRPRRLTSADVVVAVSLGVAGATWLSWLDLHAVSSRVGDGPVGHAVTVLAFTLPLVLALVPVVLATAPGSRWSGTAAVRSLSAASIALAVGNQLRLVVLEEPRTGLPAVVLAGDALAVLVVLVPVVMVLFALARLSAPRVRARVRAGMAVAIGSVTVLGVVALAPGQASAAGALADVARSAAASTTSTSDCLDGAVPDKSYAVTALDVTIPLNRFGDHDPNGKMYALTSRVAAVRAQEASKVVSVGLRDDAIQPLVIRANEGDCVQIQLTNVGERRVVRAAHRRTRVRGRARPATPLGENAASDVAAGETRTYRFAVPLDRRLEGGHYIHPGPGYRSAVSHGLFGALVIEPPGSTYWNASKPGVPLVSGWEAIIKPGSTTAACVPTSAMPTCGFREAALLHHEVGNDNEAIKDARELDVPLVDNTTGTYRPGEFALNYRSEPFRNRLLAFPKEKAHAYSSYTFGEPATPIMRGYLADPTKIRLMHVGSEKFHVFHLHGGGDRWRFNPVADTSYNYADTGLRKDPATVLSPSQRLDSQSMGPGESFDLEIEGGAGGVQQSAGDFLFHCHIAKHYNSGMWGLWRVYDTLQPDLVPPGRPGRSADGGRLPWPHRSHHQRHEDHGQQPRRLDPAAAPALRHPPRRSGRDGLELEGRRHRRRPRLPRGACRPDRVPRLTEDPCGTTEPARRRCRAHRHGTADDPLQPGERPPRLPALPDPHRQTPALHASGPLGHPVARGANANMAVSGPLGYRKDGLCPAGRTMRTFNVVAIGKTIQRTPTFADPLGKLFVLAQRQGRGPRRPEADRPARHPRQPGRLRRGDPDQRDPGRLGLRRLQQDDDAHPPRAVRRAGVRRRQRRVRLRALACVRTASPTRGSSRRPPRAPFA